MGFLVLPATVKGYEAALAFVENGFGFADCALVVFLGRGKVLGIFLVGSLDAKANITTATRCESLCPNF